MTPTFPWNWTSSKITWTSFQFTLPNITNYSYGLNNFPYTWLLNITSSFLYFLTSKIYNFIIKLRIENVKLIVHLFPSNVFFLLSSRCRLRQMIKCILPSRLALNDHLGLWFLTHNLSPVSFNCHFPLSTLPIVHP